MFRSARKRGPITPRWLRCVLLTGMLVTVSTGLVGCGLSYIFKGISPLHPTGWSMPYPIFASTQQRLEEDIAREDYDRVPILDPIPGNSTSPPCLDPPSDAEIWALVPKVRHGLPPFYEVQFNNVQILKEKIGEKVDPCKIFPMAGPCQKISCHYKCTVYYDALYWADYPIPFHHTDHKVEVVYIDKDFLRRCGGPASATTPPLEGTREAPPQTP